MFEVEYHTVDATDSTRMFIELSGVPSTATNVALDTIGGTAQALTGDFAVDGTKIKWDSPIYGLYNLINENDKLRVIYDRT